MQANRDSTMKPAAAARRYRRLADGPRPEPVGMKLYGAAQRPPVCALRFVHKRRFMLAS
jgi:hypothetical protein